jgi:hypothetical protein
VGGDVEVIFVARKRWEVGPKLGRRVKMNVNDGGRVNRTCIRSTTNFVLLNVKE